MFFLVRAQKGAGIEKVAGDGHCCRRVRGEGGGGGRSSSSWIKQLKENCDER